MASCLVAGSQPAFESPTRMRRGVLPCRFPTRSIVLNPELLDLLVRIHHLVAHLKQHLECDICFLRGNDD